MRIALEDCNIPFPSPNDVVQDLDAISQHVKEKGVQNSPTVVGELWCKLVKISILLGRILKLHSKDIWQTNAEEVEMYEAELQEHTILATITQPSNPYEQLLSCQVQIHHE